jgi:hypothetical protein
MRPEDLAKSGTEAGHQKALFCQAALFVDRYPELKWLHAIPNGGSRGDSTKSAMIRGADLKAQGVKAGVSDVMLPVKRGQWSGLYVEMKKPGHIKKTSSEQDEFIEFVRSQGYAAMVCDSWTMAWDVITKYLEWR